MTDGMRRIINKMDGNKRRRLLQAHQDALDTRFVQSTNKQASAAFQHWARFAKENGSQPFLPTEPTREERQAHQDLFNVFVLEQLVRDKERGNSQQTLVQRLSNINTHFAKFGQPRMNTDYKSHLTKAFAQTNSRPPKKAKVLRPEDIVKLKETADMFQWSWLTAIVHVIILMWFLAARWNDFYHIDIQASWANIQHERRIGRGRDVNIVLRHRKNKKFITSVSIRDEELVSGINPVDSFCILYVQFYQPMFGSALLAPWFVHHTSKTGAAEFEQDWVSGKRLTYNQAYELFQAAQRIAGLEGFSMHSARRGFTSNQYIMAQHKLMEAYVIEHMGVASAKTARGYREFVPSARNDWIHKNNKRAFLRISK